MSVAHDEDEFGGWVKVYRDIVYHPVFRRPEHLKVFIWCLTNANWKPSKRQPIGVFECGRLASAKELNMSPSCFYRALQRLKAFGCIDLQSNSQFTIVTVLNFGARQGVGVKKRTTEFEKADSKNESLSDGCERSYGDDENESEQRDLKKRTTTGQRVNNDRTHIEEVKKGRTKENTNTCALLPFETDKPSAMEERFPDPPPSKEKSKPTSKSNQPQGFADWWAVYPRKSAKPKAQEAYAKAIGRICKSRSIPVPEAEAWLLEVTTEFSKSPKALDNDRKFCPHATTFLNQDRFEDDPAEWSRGSSSAPTGQSPNPNQPLTGLPRSAFGPLIITDPPVNQERRRQLLAFQEMRRQDESRLLQPGTDAGSFQSEASG